MTLAMRMESQWGQRWGRCFECDGDGVDGGGVNGGGGCGGVIGLSFVGARSVW